MHACFSIRLRFVGLLDLRVFTLVLSQMESEEPHFADAFERSSCHSINWLENYLLQWLPVQFQVHVVCQLFRACAASTVLCGMHCLYCTVRIVFCGHYCMVFIDIRNQNG